MSGVSELYFSMCLLFARCKKPFTPFTHIQHLSWGAFDNQLAFIVGSFCPQTPEQNLMSLINVSSVLRKITGAGMGLIFLCGQSSFLNLLCSRKLS